jgi:hypothetical protein
MHVITGPHMHILVATTAIQMKIVLISKPDASRYCWIVLQQHFNVTTELNSPGFQPHKKLVAFEFCMKTVSNLLKLSCLLMMIEIELLKKTFYAHFLELSTKACSTQCMFSGF